MPAKMLMTIKFFVEIREASEENTVLMMKNISAFKTETRSGTLKRNGVNQRIKVSTLIGKTSGMAPFDKKIY